MNQREALTAIRAILAAMPTSELPKPQKIEDNSHATYKDPPAVFVNFGSHGYGVYAHRDSRHLEVQIHSIFEAERADRWAKKNRHKLVPTTSDRQTDAPA